MVMLPFYFRAKKEKMRTWNFQMPNKTLVSQLLICINDINPQLIHRKVMPIHQTSCHVNAPIFGHSLAKPQNQHNKAFQQKKKFKIYIMKPRMKKFLV
jgi:hypothetical protein